jgi:hypothetical protein
MVTPVLSNFIRPQREASVANAEHNSALTDADFLGCRWIEGDPAPLHRGMFCGLPVTEGESWCAEHRDVVFGGDLALGLGRVRHASP